MNKVYKPRAVWGGNWTEIKLEAFEKYVYAYLSIMNKQKIKYNGWPLTVYFDGFAGSGIRESKLEQNEDNLFADYFTDEETQLYKGAAERVLSLTQLFDYYFFIDNNKKAITNLKQKLSQLNLVSSNCYFISDDVNNQIARLSEFLNSQKAALVLLDPFGMQIDWKSIELLKDSRVDLWLLIPSGVIINRFLDKKGKFQFKEKLESYFGMSKEEIQKRFYDTGTIETLFGSIDTMDKTNDSIAKIAEVYTERMKKVFKYVSDEPLKLYNTKNVPIYHFVFASNNQTALRIANQIIEKKNK